MEKKKKIISCVFIGSQHLIMEDSLSNFYVWSLSNTKCYLHTKNLYIFIITYGQHNSSKPLILLWKTKAIFTWLRYQYSVSNRNHLWISTLLFTSIHLWLEHWSLHFNLLKQEKSLEGGWLYWQHILTLLFCLGLFDQNTSITYEK